MKNSIQLYKKTVQVTLCCLLLILNRNFIFAQDDTIIPVTGKGELSHNDIHGLYQDSSGPLWVLTGDGLDRYDGREFTVFRYTTGGTEKTETNNEKKLRSCAEAPDGSLWIGTNNGLAHFYRDTNQMLPVRGTPFDSAIVYDIEYNGGLYVLAGEKLFFQPEKSKNENNFIEIQFFRTVKAIARSSDGALYAGIDTVSETGAVYRISSGSLEPQPVYNDMPGLISTLYFNGGQLLAGCENGALFSLNAEGKLDRLADTGSRINMISENDGIYYLACQSGLYTYNRQGQKNTSLISGYSLPDRELYTIIKDTSGTIWTGGFNTGLLRLRQPVKGLARLPHSQLFSQAGKNIVFAGDGIAWAAVDGSALWRADIQSGELLKFNIDKTLADTAIKINAIAALPGSVWLASNLGLYRFDTRTELFTRPFDSAVYSLALEPASGGRASVLWLGTDTSLIPFDTERQVPARLPGSPFALRYGPFISVNVDSSGTVWAGTKGTRIFGKKKYDASFKEYRSDNYDMTLTTFVEDREGNIWFRTAYSLFRYNRETDTIELVKLPNQLVWDIAADPAGGLLIASEEGAYRYLDGVITPILSGNTVMTVFRDSSGALWAGTYGSGLVGITTGSDYKKYTTESGLPSNIVYNILEDRQGRLWVLTYKGLNIISDSKIIPFRLDDINSSEYFTQWGGAADSAGFFRYTGRDSIVFIDTNNIELEEAVIPFVITKINKSGLDLSPDQWRNGVRVSWDKRNIQISVAPENLSAFASFEYCLGKNTDSWISLGLGNTINLSGLSAGKTVLRVRTQSFSRLIQPELTLLVRVSPPLPLTLPAFLIYLLIAAGIAITTRYIKLQKKKALAQIAEEERRRAEQEEQYKEKDKELKDMEQKLNFIEKVSDDIKTPMTPIKDAVTSLDLRLKKERVIVSEIKTIRENIDRLEFNLEEIIKPLKKEIGCDDSHLAFPIDITRAASGYISQFWDKADDDDKKLDISSCPEDAPYFININPPDFEECLGRIMDNAIYFAKSYVKAIFSADKNTVEIAIFDDGETIEESDIEHIFEPNWKKDPDSEKHGMGLPIARAKIEPYGGTVTVKNNEEGIGKAFIISLPRCDNPKDNEEKTKYQKKTKLMLVENDKLLSDYLNEILSRDFNVEQIYTYNDALEIVQKKTPPSIVVIDHNIDEYKSTDFLQAISDDPKLDCMPVVVISGSKENKDRFEAFDKGAADYLKKPFKVDELCNRLKTIYQRDKRIINAFKIKVTELDVLPENSIIPERLPPIAVRYHIYEHLKSEDSGANTKTNKKDSKIARQLKGDDTGNLTKREKEIMERLMTRFNDSESQMAADFEISVAALKAHKQAIFKKFGLGGRTGRLKIAPLRNVLIEKAEKLTPEELEKIGVLTKNEEKE